MNPWQKLVTNFHVKMGRQVGTYPKVREAEFRASLIEEESRELVEAIRSGDLTKIAKEICDVIYVTVGAGVIFGLDIDPFMQEVHRTNMEKWGGPAREDGKIMKPEGWEPPDLATILEEQIEDAEVAELPGV